MASVMARQVFFGSKMTKMFCSPTLVPPPPCLELCFDQDPPYRVILLNASVEGTRKFKEKLCFGEGQVPAGQTQPKEQTVGQPPDL